MEEFAALEAEAIGVPREGSRRVEEVKDDEIQTSLGRLSRQGAVCQPLGGHAPGLIRETRVAGAEWVLGSSQNEVRGTHRPDYHGLTSRRKGCHCQSERSGSQLSTGGRDGWRRATTTAEKKERAPSVFQLGAEAESTQATTDVYEQEEAIEVDYSLLREDLRVTEACSVYD